MIWVHAKYLSSESRTDCCDPGSQIGKGKSTTVYMDCQCYAFSTSHAHSILQRKKRELLITRKGDIIKLAPQPRGYLSSSQIAILHCQAANLAA